MGAIQREDEWRKGTHMTFTAFVREHINTEGLIPSLADFLWTTQFVHLIFSVGPIVRVHGKPDRHCVHFSHYLCSTLEPPMVHTETSYIEESYFVESTVLVLNDISQASQLRRIETERIFVRWRMILINLYFLDKYASLSLELQRSILRHVGFHQTVIREIFVWIRQQVGRVEINRAKLHAELEVQRIETAMDS